MGGSPRGSSALRATTGRLLAVSILTLAVAWTTCDRSDAAAPPTSCTNTIAVHGATSNHLGQRFSETVAGCARGAADYVISGEQTIPAPPCAATYSAESTRSDWYQWPTGTGPVHGRFSLVARFLARGTGGRAICSYLIIQATKQTVAHAGNDWTNH